jgi:hypothetical protein
MTDKIQQFIDEITLKSRALHHQLVEERAKNERFLKEIVGLQEDIATNKELINSQSVENASLKDELEAMKLQVVEKPIISDQRKDEEIDELVKEIEYCISQLKK